MCYETFQLGIRHDNGFSLQKLGAFGYDLAALACFFDHPWDLLRPELLDVQKKWVLNEVGFCLKTLGTSSRGRRAIGIVKTKSYRATRPEGRAANTSGNLVELKLALGEVPAAVTEADEAVSLAVESGDLWQMVNRHATAGNAYHMAGDFDAARARFMMAEMYLLDASMMSLQPVMTLVGVQNACYCEWLLHPLIAETWRRWIHCQNEPIAHEVLQVCEEACKRTNDAVALVGAKGSLLASALDQLILGRCSFLETLAGNNGATL